MRIQSIQSGKVATAKKAKTAKPASKSPFSSLVGNSSDDSVESIAETPSSHIGGAALSGLLAIQQGEAVGDDASRQKQQLDWAGDLIIELRAMQQSLLGGKLNIAQLEAIQARVRQKPKFETNPQLQNLLHDIEARAAVELAKYRR